MRVVDSSVWVSYFHVDDIHHRRAEQMINQFLENKDQIVLAGIVLVEVLNAIWRLTRDNETVFKCHLALLSGEELIMRYVGTESPWITTPISFMKKVDLKTSDLIIGAFAVQLNVDRFVTLDERFEKEMAKVLSPSIHKFDDEFHHSGLSAERTYTGRLIAQFTSQNLRFEALR